MFRLFKKYLPKSLFGRTLLILLVPIILAQIISIVIFYERHWKNVSKHLASSLVGDVAMLVSYVEDNPDLTTESNYLNRVAGILNMEINFQMSKRSLPDYRKIKIDEIDNFHHILGKKINKKVDVDFPTDATNFIVYVQLNMVLTEQGSFFNIINIKVPKKRLINSTTYIFVMWIIGASIVISLIAILFLKNQVRPIVRLSRFADRFGRKKNTGDFKPEGAKEVRQAGEAFVRMSERIKSYINQRTEMLAGISHDIRTPLTRMKLELSMLDNSKKVREIKKNVSKDIEEIEKMINSYMDYVRDNEQDKKKQINLNHLIGALVEKYQGKNSKVALYMTDNVIINAEEIAIKRVLGNLLDNALKYGKKAAVNVNKKGKEAVITVEDDGPGIPEEKYGEVTSPFYRLESSRNSETGGRGLGLAIVQDIVNAHNGAMIFGKSAKLGGLKVTVEISTE